MDLLIKKKLSFYKISTHSLEPVKPGEKVKRKWYFFKCKDAVNFE